MLKEIILAIRGYLRAHRFIVEHRLWRWIIIPGILYGLLFFASMYFFWITAREIVDYGLTASGIQSWMLKYKESGWGILLVIIQIGVTIILFFFYFSLFKYIFLIIGSPLFAYLSEKTDSIIRGKDFPFSFGQLLKDIVRGIRIAIRNSLWQTVYSISILILSFIPVFGLATAVLAFFRRMLLPRIFNA